MNLSNKGISEPLNEFLTSDDMFYMGQTNKINRQASGKMLQKIKQTCNNLTNEIEDCPKCFDKSLDCNEDCISYCKEHFLDWIQIVLSKMHATLYSHQDDLSKLRKISIGIENFINRNFVEFVSTRPKSGMFSNNNNNEYTNWNWIANSGSNGELIEENMEIKFNQIFIIIKQFVLENSNNVSLRIMFSFVSPPDQSIIDTFHSNGWSGIDRHFSISFRW